MKNRMLDFSPKFERFIDIVIVLSVAFAAMEFISEESYQLFISTQWLIMGIFISEMVIKYIAFGKDFFKGWNLFDFVLVVIIIVCEILFIYGYLAYGNLAIILRFFRIIFRTLRLLRPKPLLISSTENLLNKIKSGESQYLEFKSTMYWNLKAIPPFKDHKLAEENVLKPISAFSNAEGGTLLIGVSDEGEILGLESDYESFTKGVKKDQFVLHLEQMINNAFGKVFVKHFLNIHFPIVKDKEICKIDVKKAKVPLFCKLSDKNKKFYVRIGNSSQELDIEEAAAYIKNQF